MLWWGKEACHVKDDEWWTKIHLAHDIRGWFWELEGYGYVSHFKKGSSWKESQNHQQINKINGWAHNLLPIVTWILHGFRCQCHMWLNWWSTLQGTYTTLSKRTSSSQLPFQIGDMWSFPVYTQTVAVCEASTFWIWTWHYLVIQLLSPSSSWCDGSKCSWNLHARDALASGFWCKFYSWKVVPSL